MFEYVLVVYITMNTPKYEGHFVDCANANSYAAEHYPEAVYTTCLHEDYMYLPKNLIKKEIKWK